MLAYRLAQEFEDRTEFPVQLNDVRDAVLRLQAVDALTFKPVALNTATLLGVCYRYMYQPSPYSSEEDRVDILYAESLDSSGQRLVVTKELIHILDNGLHSVANPDEVDELVRRMARRPDLRESPFMPERNDRFALAQALGILFPYAARELIKPKYDDGLVSDEMIARRAGIPEEFIDYLMSEDWEVDYKAIMDWCERQKAA